LWQLTDHYRQKARRSRVAPNMPGITMRRAG